MPCESIGPLLQVTTRLMPCTATSSCASSTPFTTNTASQPIVVFDGAGRFVGAVLRPAKRPSGVEIRAHLRGLVRAIRCNWPNTSILMLAGGHYSSPQLIDWCRASDVDFIFGRAPPRPCAAHGGTWKPAR
jgi:hypothetical protein